MVEHPVVEPEEKTPGDLRDIHFKIRIVKCASEHKLPELGAGIAQMYEETASTYRKMLVMR